MADQPSRQPFSFRLPWLTPAPQRPPVQPQPPTQFTTTIPIQRPLFRPPGTAPLQPPPQAQAPPRTESQPPSPSRTAPSARAASQPSSPSQTARAATQPSSPSQPQPATRAASQTPSPSRTVSQPPSPPKPPPQLETTAQARPQAPSPSKQASQQQPATQESSQLSPSREAPRPPSPPRPYAPQPAPPSDLPSQAQTEPSQAPSQQTWPQVETTSEPIPSSQFYIPTEITSETETLAKQPQPPQMLYVVATGATPSTMVPGMTAQPESSFTTTSVDDITRPPKSETKPDEAKEGMTKIEGDAKEISKTSGLPSEEPKQKTITELLKMAPDSTAEPREQTGITSQAEERQQQKLDKIFRSESRQKPTISSGERASLDKKIKDDFSRFAHKLAIEHPKGPIDESPASIITLAGENRGATMQIGHESARREASLNIHRGSTLNQLDKPEMTTDGEGSSSRRKLNDPNAPEDSVTATYTNCNVQTINNSIMFNSSINERNPGVHLVLGHHMREPIKSNGSTNPMEPQRVDFNLTPAQRHTYEPTVRRRCLRGLFREPSDSDPDNPEKPRRHGCKYDCEETKGSNRGKEIL